jgi:hypothetical protein
MTKALFRGTGLKNSQQPNVNHIMGTGAGRAHYTKIVGRQRGGTFSLTGGLYLEDGIIHAATG